MQSLEGDYGGKKNFQEEFFFHFFTMKNVNL
jgi:hypothetical protein